MNILIANRQRIRKIRSAELKKIVTAALADLGVEEGEIEINLVGAAEMAALNETFLEHEGATDVITFDYAGPPGGKPGPEPGLAGEIFVCIDEAVRQAKQFGTTWQSETVRYIVHGVLHLLGYDDLRPDRRRKMKREENLRLRRLSKKFSLAQIAGRSKISR
jgi:probable rRNA maturation factor